MTLATLSQRFRPALSRSLHTCTPAQQAIAAEDRQIQARSQISRIDARNGTSVSPFMMDSFGRGHDYLRISLTEKCNLRCTYCMPAEGVPLSPRENMLSTEEIIRVAKLFALNGISKIRLTGGEPTIRTDLQSIIAQLTAMPSITSLGMTTNGLALHRKLPSLVKAGLTNINLSLDTMDEFKFELMTRRRGHSAVLNSLHKAISLLPPPGELAERGKHLSSVKLNVVMIKGVNDEELPAFIDLARRERIGIRFIEYMPFDDNSWATAKLVPTSELLARVQAIQPDLAPLPHHISDTAKAYHGQNWQGNVGFISSMTEHFCAGCSRLRLAADGRFKVCLFGPPKLSLRPLLRDGASDQELLNEISVAIKGKKFAHDGKSNLEMLAAAKNAPMVHIENAYQQWSRRTNHLHLLQLAIRPRQRVSSTSATVSKDAPKLTHFDSETGRPKMVSVSNKASTHRDATAVGTVEINSLAQELLQSGQNKKGDVLTVAQLAGIMGAKQTSNLIPLCHPLYLSHVSVELEVGDGCVNVKATAETEGNTGVEMEALTAVQVACLTVWDMLKAVSGKDMCITNVKVVSKSGGKSGDWTRDV